jgi:hypothetical protein
MGHPTLGSLLILSELTTDTIQGHMRGREGKLLPELEIREGVCVFNHFIGNSCICLRTLLLPFFVVVVVLVISGDGGLTNYLSRLVSNSDPPDLSLPSS